MRRLWWVPIVLLAVGIAVGVAKEGKAPKEIGLSPTDVFETTVTAPASRTENDPGDGENVPVPYPGAPPVISHAVDDFLPITREENICIMCHGDPDSGATAIPYSHYLDLRNAPDEKRKEIAGTRQVCTACHVVPTAAPLLVENEFDEAPR